jgi:hypothetical protein
VHAQALSLANEFSALARGRLRPSTLVLKTRPDVIIDPRIQPHAPGPRTDVYALHQAQGGDYGDGLVANAERNREQSARFARMAAARLRSRDGPRQIWSCKGWHELGLSDVAFVTSFEGLTDLSRAYQCCLPHLLESGVLPCNLMPMPEVVLRIFVEALGFKIHNGAFDLRWCRNSDSCLRASEPAVGWMGDRLAAFRAAVVAARACTSEAPSTC